MHNRLFPIAYEEEFFRKATLGLDAISSCAAFDQRGELVAFITFRTVAYSSCEDQARAVAAGCRPGLELTRTPRVYRGC